MGIYKIQCRQQLSIVCKNIYLQYLGTIPTEINEYILCRNIDDKVIPTLTT